MAYDCGLWGDLTKEVAGEVVDERLQVVASAGTAVVVEAACAGPGTGMADAKEMDADAVAAAAAVVVQEVQLLLPPNSSSLGVQQ